MSEYEEAFHAGERGMQLRAGVAVRNRLAAHGAKIIRDSMSDQHRDFFEQLPFIVIGSVDAEGQPWASLLANRPGFIAAPTAQVLTIAALPDIYDPLAVNLQQGAALGLLGIEPHTRRRNRMNGIVAERNDKGFAVRVQQSFGNCPKYIQARTPTYVDRKLSGTVTRSRMLDANAQQLIGKADTFFIASTYPTRADNARAHGVDVSHRGGKPGFVRIVENRLTVPDFVGNFFFNTLGNLILEPRAGLLFVDFDKGDLLYLAVRAEIIWDGVELKAFVGAERLLRMTVLESIYVPAVLSLRWGPAQISPYLSHTDT